MRLLRIFSLSLLFVILPTFCAIVAPGQEQRDPPSNRGAIAPHSAADKYRAHGEQSGVSVGAELLTRKEVAKEFAAELNGCCLVVLVAVYPKKDEPLDLTPSDFTLAIEGTETRVRPQSATIVAARLEKGKSRSSGPAVTTAAGIGYESGTYTDSVTGQPVRVHGVSTSTGVGVTSGNGEPPDVAERDREVIEDELSEKGLPEAKVSVPVAGYLYFALPSQKKDTKYRLEFAAKDQTVELALP